MAAARDTPLSPGDLFRLTHLRDASLAPGGRKLAYCLSKVEEGVERFEIRLHDLSTGGSRKVPLDGNATSPQWSPDGRMLALAVDGRLAILDPDTDRIDLELTPPDLRLVGKPSWSPDGWRLAACLRRCTPFEGAVRVTGDVYRADGLGMFAQLQQAVWIIEPCTGAATRLSPEGLVCTAPQWNPQDERVLFLGTERAIPFASYSPRLHVADVATGVVEQLTDERWFIELARWLPDGRRIAATAARDSDLTIPLLSLWVLDPSDAGAVLRTPAIKGHVGYRINNDMPGRELTGGNGLVVADNDWAYLTVQVGGTAGIWRVSLAGETCCEPLVTGECSAIIIDRDPRTRRLIYAVSSLHAPFELFSCDENGQAVEPITALNEEVLKTWPTLAVTQFSFTNDKGQSIESWFLADARREGALPSILFIHSGPFAAAGHAYFFDLHLLASHGFGVIFANFRGSTGYGEEFARSIVGNWGAKGFPDHAGAVDEAVARGLADPARLGVWGASHGGFATCWMVTHTGRFKAAIAEAAVTDFTTLYYHTDAPATFVRDLGGSPGDLPELYRANSPLTYAARCRTPLLLIHGEADLRCPIGEAEQFHRALIDAGCHVELLRIPDCSHLGPVIGPVEARLAQNTALVDWFNRFLGVRDDQGI